METNIIRKRSLKEADKLGFPVNPALPLLDECIEPKPVEHIVQRLLCLHVIAACAYGFDRGKANDWIKSERLGDSLSPAELDFLRNPANQSDNFKCQIEGMWALAWALGLIPKLDFADECDSNFVFVLPDLKVSQPSSLIRSRIQPRTIDAQVAACDLAYCLHWAIRQAQLVGADIPGKVAPYVIIERRRALEWLLSSAQWDEITLDT
jgi:hypothetical protein